MTAAYDAERPHMRVMGIAHVYVAADPPFAARPACEPAPRDGAILDRHAPGRRAPPRVSMELAGETTRPPSAIAGDVLVRVRGLRFDRPAISIRRNAKVHLAVRGPSAARCDARRRTRRLREPQVRPSAQLVARVRRPGAL